MERKARIISRSGQPLSGKSTAIAKMSEILKEQGIKEEDIHVVSVGKMFREYFNNIIDLAKNMKKMDKEQLKQISIEDKLKDLCSNPMLKSALKKALINLLMSKFDLETFDIEKANNSPELKEIRDLIDTIVDTRVAELGEKAIKENKENEVWIMDSRLAFSNIPDSFSVRLTVRDDIAGERLFAGTKKRGKEDNNYKDVQEAMEKTIKRGQGEERRYKERYGVELSNEENYNIVIDTSFSNEDDIANTILKCEELHRQRKTYERNWTSPKVFLPRQTLDGMIYSLSDLEKNVKAEGYRPDSAIMAVEENGRLWAWDGHHRIAVAASTKQGLIPYYIDAEISKEVIKRTIENVKISALYDFEDIFRSKEKDKKFSYNDIYAGIYEEIKNRQNNTDAR